MKQSSMDMNFKSFCNRLYNNTDTSTKPYARVCYTKICKPYNLNKVHNPYIVRKIHSKCDYMSSRSAVMGTMLILSTLIDLFYINNE